MKEAAAILISRAVGSTLPHDGQLHPKMTAELVKFAVRRGIVE
jgi:hypothetical protein